MNRRLWSNRTTLVLAASTLTALAAVTAPGDAVATTLQSYGNTVFSNVDLTGLFGQVAPFLGSAGVLISGWNLYEGTKDGGRFQDHVGAIMGLGASALLLGYAGLKGALQGSTSGSSALPMPNLDYAAVPSVLSALGLGLGLG